MKRETTDRKTRRKNMGRRIMASVCAIAIALLQCAVILTIDTESVHAAELKVKAKCEGGTASKTIKTDDLSSSAITPIPGTDKTGITLDELFSKIVNATEYESIKTYKGDYFLEPIEMKIYKADGTDEGSTDEILYNMKSGYTPVEKITINDGSITVDAGQSKNVNFSVDGDSFFAGDSGKYEDYIEWSSNNEEAVTVSNGVVTGKDKGGTATITVKSKVGGVSKTVSVKGNPKSTEASSTSVTTTTASKKSLKGATIKLKRGSKIYNKNYSEEEIKSKITVTDKKGKKVDSRDYTIVKASVKGNKVNITIKGTNNYEGEASGSIGYSSSTETKTKTTKYRSNTYRTFSRSPVTGTTSSSGTTVPNVTYAPDRTITVKEVFLGQEIAQEPEPAPTPADMMNDAAEDMMENGNSDWAEDQSIDLDFGPMAGSAAVAVAACGAGAVGRVRRFKVDTAAEVVKQITNSKGK